MTDGTASIGEGEDFPVPPSVVAAAAAAELGFPAPGNKALLHPHCLARLMCPTCGIAFWDILGL